MESLGLKKQTRVKRACDSCAKQKLKCTFQVPCDHCTRKQLLCTHTRAGYVDPYEGFRIGKEKDGPNSAIVSQQAWCLPAANPDSGSVQTVDELSSSAVTENQSNGMPSRLYLPDGTSGATKDTADLSSLLSYGIDASCLTQEQEINYSQGFSPTDFDIAANLTFPFAGGFGSNLLSLSMDMTQQAHHFSSETSFQDDGTSWCFPSNKMCLCCALMQTS